MSVKRLLDQLGASFVISYTPRGELEIKTDKRSHEVIVRAMMKYGIIQTNEGRWGEFTHRVVVKNFGAW